ncbi:MAG: NAD(P)H-dependent oxidoreductase [Anaerolineales bacterium]|jgi:FMN reductase
MAIEIVTMAGSVRPDNYTEKALAVVVNEMEKQPNVVVHQINLGEIDFTLPGRPLRDPRVKELRQIISNATAVVIATPEYHGTFSSLIKLAIENLGHPNALKGKPVALLGVAGGRIGAIKSLEHLRSVSAHVGAVVIPSLLSLDRVRERFDLDGTPLDGETEIRLRGLASALMEYINEFVCPKFKLEEMLSAEPVR